MVSTMAYFCYYFGLEFVFLNRSLQAWMNEKFSPELLEPKTHIVDCILEQIKEMVCINNYNTGRLVSVCVGGGEVGGVGGGIFLHS